MRIQNIFGKNAIKEDRVVPVFNEGYESSKFHASRGEGGFIEDDNGRRYLDVALCGGTHILGHSHPLILQAIEKQIKDGTLFTVANYLTYDVAELLIVCCRHLDSFVFCNSGTEATIRAVRIARAYTGKKKIAMFSGGWHGGNDMLLFEEDYSGQENQPKIRFRSGGLPEELLSLIVLLPYNDALAFDIIDQHKDELAMVFIEPAQGSNPRDGMGPFLTKLRQITDRNHILLGFDEVMTGFRLALGGGQEFYDIEADIVTYGKVLGGGLPIGAVGGKRDVMEIIMGDKGGRRVFMGGTFSANPLVMALSKTILSYLIDNKETVYSYLNVNSQRIRNEINQYCMTNKLPVRMMGIASMSRLIFTDKLVQSRKERDLFEIDTALQNRFYRYLLQDVGIFINTNGIIFLSTAHKEVHIQMIIDGIKQGLDHYSDEFTTTQNE